MNGVSFGPRRSVPLRLEPMESSGMKALIETVRASKNNGRPDFLGVHADMADGIGIMKKSRVTTSLRRHVFVTSVCTCLFACQRSDKRLRYTTKLQGLQYILVCSLT